MASIYDLLGEAKIRKLTKLFYQGIEDDEIIRPMYPKDMEPAEERLALFLIQVFGGPTTYSDQKGHPRLRMRHFPYAINLDARQRWMKHMLVAMDQIEMEEVARAYMIDYFEKASLHMINRQG